MTMPPLRVLMLSAGLSAVLWTGCARAQDQRIEVDLPAGSLVTAVDTLARQASLQLVYDRRVLDGRQATALKGSLSPREALARLLAGSGLAVTFTSANSAAIRVATPGADTPTVLRPVTVDGAAVAGAPASTSYAAPVAATATKLATPVLETPAQVQVVTAQALQDRRPTSLGDALAQVSGVVASTNDYQHLGAGEYIVLRGFASKSDFNTTGTYVMSDGVRGDGSSATLQLGDVESIEVLKGPAAILYGRIEPGGVVNVQSKKPQDQAHAAVEVLAGSWQRKGAHLDIGGPLDADKTLLYRVNLGRDLAGSWREGEVYSRASYLSPSLLWKPTAATRIGLDLKLDASRLGEDYQATPWVDGRPAVLPPARNLSEPSPGRQDNQSTRLTLHHEWSPQWALDARAVHSHNRYDSLSTQILSIDSTGGVSPWIASRALVQVAFERRADLIGLDLTGNFTAAGLRHKLLAGVEHTRSRGGFSNQLGIDDGLGNFLAPIDVENPDHTIPPLVLDPTSERINTNSQTERGVYLQDQVEIGADWHLLAGLRWQRFKSESHDRGSFVADDSRSESATTPRLALLWRATPALSLWTSYTENFGAGYGRIYPGTPMPPTGARQIELGAKGEWLGGDLQVSAALFNLTKTNIATADPDPTHLPAATWQVPIGEARSRGLEIDLQGKLDAHWSAVAGYAHTDARITRNETLPALVGDRLPGAPRDMAHLWLTHAQAADAGSGGWRLGGGVNWRSPSAAIRFDDSAPQPITNPAQTLVNMMVSYAWRLGGHPATAQFNIDNLFDKTTWTVASAPSGEWANITYGNPRSMRASLKVEF